MAHDVRGGAESGAGDLVEDGLVPLVTEPGQEGQGARQRVRASSRSLSQVLNPRAGAYMMGSASTPGMTRRSGLPSLMAPPSQSVRHAVGSQPDRCRTHGILGQSTVPRATPPAMPRGTDLPRSTSGPPHAPAVRRRQHPERDLSADGGRRPPRRSSPGPPLPRRFPGASGRRAR
jgi:hypothetical protein